MSPVREIFRIFIAVAGVPAAALCVGLALRRREVERAPELVVGLGVMISSIILMGPPRFWDIAHVPFWCATGILVTSLVNGIMLLRALPLLAALLLAGIQVVSFEVSPHAKMTAFGWLFVAGLVGIRFAYSPDIAARRLSYREVFPAVVPILPVLSGWSMQGIFVALQLLCATILAAFARVRLAKYDESNRVYLAIGMLVSTLSAMTIAGEATSLEISLAALILTGATMFFNFMPTKKRLLRALAPLSAMFSLTTMMVDCSPLKPSPPVEVPKEKEVTGNGVLLTLDSRSLAALPMGASKMLVRIYRLELKGDGMEALGSQEGPDREVSLSTPNPTVTIDQLEVGRKELQVSIISDLDDQIGYGAMRIGVTLGINEIREPLLIRLIPEEQRIRAWDVGFNVSFVRPGAENEVIYSEVESIIRSQCAEGCHNPVARKGNLDLLSFPFASSEPSLETQEDIVRESIVWMRDFTYPMPPPPLARVPDGDIAKVQSWLDSGLPTRHTSLTAYESLVKKVRLKWQSQSSSEAGEVDLERRDGMNFGKSLRAMKIGAKYTITITVLAESEIVLGQKVVQDALLRGRGDLREEVRINYVPPVVRVPVVISQ